jgi:hypothetical protein
MQIRRVSHMRKGRHAMWGRVSLLLNSIKKIFNSIFSMYTSSPANGCHATGTREAHALHGAGGLCGAQAVKNLRTGHRSWV